MDEIGGYIELDRYNNPMLHDGAVALNCGRNALAYVSRAKGIKKIRMPLFICDSVPCVCAREGITVEYYHVGADLLPFDGVELEEDEWLYIVNYYGQIDNELLTGYRNKYKRIIVDNAHGYFQMPIDGVDTIYTCRKYFGVADGAFLYTDALFDADLPKDESHSRMGFLLGRFERPASEFYAEYIANNALMSDEPIKRMSKLTRNLLCGIDYKKIEKIREENFEFLHSKLGYKNILKIRHTGTFMYPLLVEGGAEIRSNLQEKKIYVPLLWPSVAIGATSESIEHYLAENILPLPIDQRYGKDELTYVVESIKTIL